MIPVRLIQLMRILCGCLGVGVFVRLTHSEWNNCSQFDVAKNSISHTIISVMIIVINNINGEITYSNV